VIHFDDIKPEYYLKVLFKGCEKDVDLCFRVISNKKVDVYILDRDHSVELYDKDIGNFAWDASENGLNHIFRVQSPKSKSNLWLLIVNRSNKPVSITYECYEV